MDSIWLWVGFLKKSMHAHPEIGACSVIKLSSDRPVRPVQQETGGITGPS